MYRRRRKIDTMWLKRNDAKRFICMIITIVISVYPMSLSPVWNGTIPGHRDQYERMAQSILNGHLYLEYEDVDPRLSEMENPYDPQARKELGIYYHWDHAFYNGKYYMYFGIVPVVLLFLPYQLLTGNALTTYKATQIFTVGTILAIFALFDFLRKKIFSKMPFDLYLILSMVLSFVSVWYAIVAPALYCTAIMSAVFMEIISLNLMVRVVWDSEQKNGRKMEELSGSFLCASLAFGCRPTIALSGILQIMLFYLHLHELKSKKKSMKACLTAGIPCLVTAILLMWYNYARFGSILEFGQHYQLTVADQRLYSLFAGFRLDKIINGLVYQFASWSPIQEKFPYISYEGILFAFPVFWCIAAFLQDSVKKEIKEKHLTAIINILIALIIGITVFDSVYTPYMVTRYQLDVNFLLGIACFVAVGFRCETAKNRGWNRFVWITAVMTLLILPLLILVPYDGNFTEQNPQILTQIEKMIFWWR